MDTNTDLRDNIEVENQRRREAETVRHQTKLNVELCEWMEWPLTKCIGSGPLHLYEITDSWDYDKLVESFGDKLLHSSYEKQVEPDESQQWWSGLTFQFAKQTFVLLSGSSLRVFAPQRAAAKKLAERLHAGFVRPVPTEAHFFILKCSHGIATQYVKLTGIEALNDEMLTLHYGEDICEWQQTLIDGFAERSTGISL
ncbi:MAG: hypothetical protein AAGA95_20840, partial [Pseudomonadota bacterium]